MSHIVSIKTQVRDPVAIRSACSRLRIPEPTYGEAKLFTSKATGWRVQLNGWRYPVVCDTDTGNVAYDNYEGRWGDRSKLDAFLQRYAVEKASLEARRNGYTVTEQTLTDGAVKLKINVGGDS